MWHAATGQLLRSFEGHRGAIESVAFAPDGTRFLSESHRTLKLWDAMTGELLGTFAGHPMPTSSAMLRVPRFQGRLALAGAPLANWGDRNATPPPAGPRSFGTLPEQG